MEVYYSWEEEEYAQIDQEHIQLHKSLWDNVKQQRSSDKREKVSAHLT